MGRSGQDTERDTPLGRRALGLRLLVVAGVLLALDLFLLPWHEAGIDAGGVPDRVAVEEPNAGLGIAAAVGGMGLAAYAGMHAFRGLGGRDGGPAPADRIALYAGPAVLGVLVLKLVLETDQLGIGAWLGLVLGAAVAYGGFVVGQEALLALGEHFRPGGGRRYAEGMTQQQKWLLLGTAIVVAALVAVALPDDGEDELVAPVLPDTSAAVTTPSLPEESAPQEPESTAVPGEEAPAVETTTADGAPAEPEPTAPLPGRGTTVEPTTAETGGGVTVTGRGATPGEAYVVRLHRDPSACATSGVQLGGARVAEADGTIPGGRAVIPTNATSGTYYVCLANAADPSISLPPATLIVA